MTLAGLALVAFYEGSVSNLAFEHYLRPEAIFPFFAILNLLLLLEFIHAWFLRRRPVRAALLALGGAVHGRAALPVETLLRVDARLRRPAAGGGVVLPAPARAAGVARARGPRPRRR